MNRLAAGAVLVSVLALGCTSTTPPSTVSSPVFPEHCPAVHRIHGDAAPEEAWDIVILGEGFSEQEMPAYRCAVGILVGQLMQHQPLARFRCGFNVYRIDVVDPMGDGVGVRGTCNQAAGPPPPPTTLQGDEGECMSLVAQSGESMGDFLWPPGPACWVGSLNAEFCSHPDAYQYVWPDPQGREIAYQLAHCAPGADTVIIIVNSKEKGGGGGVTHAGGPDTEYHLATASLMNIQLPGYRTHLLAHELGHTMVLLDEYTTAGFGGWTSDRNLISKAELEAGKTPSWNSSCPDDVTPPGLSGALRCGVQCENSDCMNLCPGSGDEFRCCEDKQCCATGSCSNECWSDVPPNGFPEVGLWQGGYYDSCRFFRSQETCVMGSVDSLPAEATYCAACRGLMHQFLNAAGLPSCRFSPQRELILEFMDSDRIMRLIGYFPPVRAPWWKVGDLAMDRGRAFNGTLRADLMWPVAKFRAYVDRGRFSGEVDIQEAIIPLQDPHDRGAVHTLRIRRVQGRTTSHLEWSLNGTVATPGRVPRAKNQLPLEFSYRPAGPVQVLTRYGRGRVEASGLRLELFDGSRWRQSP